MTYSVGHNTHDRKRNSLKREAIRHRHYGSEPAEREESIETLIHRDIGARRFRYTARQEGNENRADQFGQVLYNMAVKRQKLGIARTNFVELALEKARAEEKTILTNLPWEEECYPSNSKLMRELRAIRTVLNEYNEMIESAYEEAYLVEAYE